MNWIKHPTLLTGKNVILTPLEPHHFDSLIDLATDKRIWQYYAVDGSRPEKLRAALEHSLNERVKGTQYPFAIHLLPENSIIGSTRLLDIQQEHKKLEIGWTWLHPNYWGTGVNTECKLLLLSYCFEQLGVHRVQLKTDKNNARSRKAIEKIGGQFEGVFRNDMIRENGTNRDSAYYSIIATEWPETRLKLENK